MCFKRLVYCLKGLNIFIVLTREELLEVGGKGGFYYIKFTTMTSTVGISPFGIFRRFTSFVDFFCNLHLIKYIQSVLTSKYQPFRYDCFAQKLGTAWSRILFRSSYSIFWSIPTHGRGESNCLFPLVITKTSSKGGDYVSSWIRK